MKIQFMLLYTSITDKGKWLFFLMLQPLWPLPYLNYTVCIVLFSFLERVEGYYIVVIHFITNK